MYKAVEIANYFIRKGKSSGRPVDNMKLQKLIYISHGYHLAIKNDPLIDEPIQAWDFGPVIESVYHAFKHNGNMPITKYYKEGFLVPTTPIITAKKENETLELLKTIWDSYGSLTGIELANLTHEIDSPWEKTVRGFANFLPKYLVINNDLIRDYYKHKLDAIGD